MAEATIKQLQAAITECDELSQEGFGDIGAIARLATLALETREGQRNVEGLARAFEAIWGICSRVVDSISDTAERAGCGYTDSRVKNRGEAAREANHD